MKRWFKQALVVALNVGLIFAFFYFELDKKLTFAQLKTQRDWIETYYLSHTWQVISIYLLIYIGITAASLPGAAILTLAGGYLFGLTTGTIVVSFASTIGATLAFLLARFVFRSAVQSQFADRLKVINEGVQQDGKFYLFTLRLLPIFPFFLINLLMGLTPMSVRNFYLVSQLAMLPGTIAYVNAGTQLGQIDSLSGILSPSLLLSFAVIGTLPWIAKLMVTLIKRRRKLRAMNLKFNKPKKFDYDIVVIGGGAAGLVTSYIGAAVKARVALIEKNRMGGDCLNTGCVPSKALIRSAKARHQMRHADQYGLLVKADAMSNFSSDEFTRVMERVQEKINKIAPHDSIERYTDLGVDCLTGTAHIESPYCVRIDDRQLTTRNIVVATGASPIVPNLPGIELVPHYTSDTIWSIKNKPKKLLILGGGPIGCELAQAFARLDIKVTQIERSHRLLIREDAEVSQTIEKKFREEGLCVLTQHEASRVVQKDGRAFLVCLHQEQEVEIECDAILFALGRKAHVTGFGLEKLGVELTNRGTIDTNDYLQTLHPNIFACGDVVGPYQFTHTASHQAWYASVNALFRPFKKFKVDYSVIPWCTYTDPEVARVGLNEQEAKEKGIPYLLSEYHIDDLDRAIVDSETQGYIRVLTQPGSDKILGVTFVGSHAGDLIAEFVLAMKNKLGLNKILSTIHIYPTFAEANKYVAGVWKRQTAPQWALKWLQKFHSWRRS